MIRRNFYKVRYAHCKAVLVGVVVLIVVVLLAVLLLLFIIIIIIINNPEGFKKSMLHYAKKLERPLVLLLGKAVM